MAVGLSHARLPSLVKNSAGLTQTHAGASQLFSCGTAVAYKEREEVAVLKKVTVTACFMFSAWTFIPRVAQHLTELSTFILSTPCQGLIEGTVHLTK